ncbi:MAG: hypothetical protein HYZ00_00205, partial [Candidatus Hydrogenedentes bacterium]|nr:hypothetical protein [Candidatus Hydrogenedentota bacterium]
MQLHENETSPTAGTVGCTSGCACVDRRTFVKAAGLGALALLNLPGQAMAGPFDASDFERLVPADKKLTREWLDALFARGVPRVYRGDDLKLIGMPVGGICAGQVNLGGDGRLWHWDIFNKPITTGAEHYATPMTPESPLAQGFRLKVREEVRALDAMGFAGVSFRGEYPIGTVDYRDPVVPVEVRLEAFSPFIPLNTEDSSLPAIVMRFTLKNTGAHAVEAELTGYLENVVCLYSNSLNGLRCNRVAQSTGLTFIESTARKSEAPPEAPRPDILFENWDKDTYEGWSVEGTAFGTGPILKSAMPEYQGDVGGDTERVVNSHASAPGGEVGGKDTATGRLLSRAFAIERRFIRFWIGGGSSSNTCVNLLVDGKAVRTASGQNNNKMALQTFDVRRLKGTMAHLEIVDAESGGWGNIGVGSIVFSDQPLEMGALETLHDFGSMGIGLIGEAPDFASSDAEVPIEDTLMSEIGRRLPLDPGQTATVSFIITWHFPNLSLDKLPGGRFYATRFNSALAVA